MAPMENAYQVSRGLRLRIRPNVWCSLSWPPRFRCGNPRTCPTISVTPLLMVAGIRPVSRGKSHAEAENFRRSAESCCETFDACSYMVLQAEKQPRCTGNVSVCVSHQRPCGDDQNWSHARVLFRVLRWQMHREKPRNKRFDVGASQVLYARR